MSVPNTSELDDDQIEALIRKLSAIKGSAPELIAALEAEANSRLASKSHRSGRSGGSRGRDKDRNNNPPRNSNSRSQSYEDDEEDDDDDYDEDDDEEDDEETDSEEDDDEFDEDGPCVGYGYSDEVSVISEMTTPTVVSSIHVNPEERYDELRMGGKQNNKPDLLSQVNRANAAKNKKGGGVRSPSPALSASSGGSGYSGGGLNAEKRKTYTSGLSAMAKISETEAAVPTKPKGSTPRATKKQPARKGSQDGGEKTPRSSKAKERGLSRRDNSPNASDRKSKPKKTTSGKKPSSGTKKKTRSPKDSDDKDSAGGNSNDHADAFGDDWHKSLTAGDFNGGTDGNGFPFSFEDTNNAFAQSTNSFFNNKGTSGGETDAFDPFSNGDPFKNSDAFASNNKDFSAPAATSSGGAKKKTSRPRRSSKLEGGSTRSSKNRDGSPRRKGAR